MLKTTALLFALAASPALAVGLDVTVSGQANGTFHIELFEDVAPQHVAQITALANEGAYNGVVFHRVIDGFMAQTGDVEFGRAGGDMAMAGLGGSTRPDLPLEASDRSFQRGIVGMARSPADLNSANSQFFIMFNEDLRLNGDYTVVGEVTSGMDVVDQIKRGSGENGVVSDNPDVMTSVVVTP
jgi:peptidylprolyl isomerase